MWDVGGKQGAMSSLLITENFLVFQSVPLSYCLLPLLFPLHSPPSLINYPSPPEKFLYNFVLTKTFLSDILNFFLFFKIFVTMHFVLIHFVWLAGTVTKEVKEEEITLKCSAVGNPEVSYENVRYWKHYDPPLKF